MAIPPMVFMTLAVPVSVTAPFKVPLLVRTKASTIPPANSAIVAEPDNRSIVDAARVAVPLPSVPVMLMPVLPALDVSVAFSVIVPLPLTRN